ncbi:MAG TPA: hypothetical protein VFG89_10105 [Coriobacteriia bacterium]|nr:hypothetical protein [Coriobacteriia bacterium]
MAGEQRVRVDGGMGVLWCIGWLFTIGYLKLSFWVGVFAIILWPYYLGTAVR